MKKKEYKAEGYIICDASMIIHGTPLFDLNRPVFYVRLFYKGDNDTYESFETVIDNEDVKTFLDHTRDVSKIPFDKHTYEVLELCIEGYKSNFYHTNKKSADLKLDNCLMAFIDKESPEVNPYLQEACRELVETSKKKEKGQILPEIYEELSRIYEQTAQKRG